LIAELGGLAVIVIGLSAWLGKIWAGRILENDRQHYREELEGLKSSYEATNKSLQAELEKRIHVHRVQFEAEFRALSEIWAKITDLRSDMTSIRPLIDVAFENEDPMEKYRRRLLRFSQTLAETKTLIFKFAPFYSEEIYKQLWSVLEIASREERVVSVACRMGRESPDWYEQGEAQVNKMVAQADVVSSAIRTRMENLSILFGVIFRSTGHALDIRVRIAAFWGANPTIEKLCRWFVYFLHKS
jgi:hypothetical protein